jgi:hypothetical protein
MPGSTTPTQDNRVHSLFFGSSAGSDRGDYGAQERHSGEANREGLSQFRVAVHGVGEDTGDQQADKNQKQEDQQSERGHDGLFLFVR